jgi:Nif-specific regulatory protein
LGNLTALPAERFESLLEVGRLLNSTLELDEVLDHLVTRAGELVQCEGTSLLLLDSSGTSLVFSVAKGEKGKALRERRLPLGSGIAGWVAQQGKPVIVRDVHKDARFYPGCDEEIGFDTRSILAAPLTVRGQIIGVIEAVNSTRTGGFMEDDLSLFTAFAHLAAIALENARLYASVNREREHLRDEVARRYQIVGESSALARVVEMAQAAANSKATVLLLGESGTGKEIFARAINHWSPRAAKPFVAVNCSTLSQELLASELFGHERGAFTGAVRQKPGKVEQAEGGTLFLDEIGDMRPELQTKLLRVLQEHEFERVGGTRTIPVDIRVIAATNCDLEQEVKRGNFREDLYYRLNVVAIRLPLLRERREDIDALINFFLEKHAKESRKNLKTIAPAAVEALRAYNWPGNVRELDNVIQRGIILSKGERIELSDLPAEITAVAPGPLVGGQPVTNEDLKEAKREARDRAAAQVEREFLERILAASKGNVTQAAASSGINRTLLQQLLKKYQIDRSRFMGK